MTLIDCHVHIGKDDRMGYELTSTELQRIMKLHNVEYAVIFPCPWDYSKPTYAHKNETIIQVANEFNNLIPALLIDPTSLDSIILSIQLIESSSKVKALKFYPPAQNYDPQSVISSKIWETAILYQLPLIFHTSLVYEQTAGILDVAEKYPYPVIAAHAFRLSNQLLMRASRIPNLYIDVSPMNTFIALANTLAVPNKERPRELQDTFLNPKVVTEYLFELMKGQLIWGSDLPWSLNLHDSEGEWHYLQTLDAPMVERMMQNAKNIFL